MSALGESIKNLTFISSLHLNFYFNEILTDGGICALGDSIQNLS